MSAGRTCGDIGCLCIDELLPGRAPAGGAPLCAAPGMLSRAFRPRGGEGLWEALQVALQALRAEARAAAILARGTGCAAALALAAQLPVERLALVDPLLSPARVRGGGPNARAASTERQVRAIARYARRNLSLCACDMLVLQHARGERISRRDLSPYTRLTGLLFRGESREDLLNNREIMAKQALDGFLRTGDLPKSLAENPEMCIIYG